MHPHTLEFFSRFFIHTLRLGAAQTNQGTTKSVKLRNRAAALARKKETGPQGRKKGEFAMEMIKIKKATTAAEATTATAQAAPAAQPTVAQKALAWAIAHPEDFHSKFFPRHSGPQSGPQSGYTISPHGELIVEIELAD